MIGKIIEIAHNQRHLSVFRGFMLVHSTEKNNKAELKRIPLDNIAAIVGNAHGLSYTNNLLVALAERGVPFVLCGSNHNVVGMLLAVDGQHQQAKRFDAQISASMPTTKKIWSQIVKAKLGWQAITLEKAGLSSDYLKNLIKKVKSGDATNIEAQGARKYWTLLFGSAFRRDRAAEGINTLLNYGYTVLRATTARSVVAAGLHPTIGLHHKNESNPMRLVDDLMEPFRPIIDLRVWQLHKENKNEINAETKQEIASCMFIDLQTNLGISPVLVCIQRCATSLAQCYLRQAKILDLPSGFSNCAELFCDEASAIENVT